MSYFPQVSAVQYEGPESKNPLAFHHYEPDRVVTIGKVSKTAREWLRFAATWWHTMRGTGSDPFGTETRLRPWDNGTGSLDSDLQTVEAMFEFLDKLGIDFFAFHDRDIATEQGTLAETNTRLDAVVAAIKDRMAGSGKKLLWGTANLFSNRRFVHGAATSCDPRVFAHAAAQVKKALEVTHLLDGAGYVFWGGREGYQYIHNTNLTRELDNLARLIRLAVEYKKELGFTGTFYIEPKPHEPTTHQYDRDAATCLAFLRKYGLEGEVLLNLETNHATLAGLSMQHELEVAAANNALGSIDANVGEDQVGWDTDHFLIDARLAAEIMYVICRHGGLTTGGVNFDAKVRRESFEPIDLFHAHIGSMDAFARGLYAAAKLINSGELERLKQKRYSGWTDTDLGKEIEGGKHTLATLEQVALAAGDVGQLESGREEVFRRVLAEAV